MKIIEYPLTPSFFILLFEARDRTAYHVSNDGLMIENKNYICTDFSNSNNNLINKQVVGRISHLGEDKIVELLERAGVKNIYLNYQDETEIFKTAKESLISYIITQGWDVDLEKTHLVALKKSKKLKGKKIPMEFELCAKDFKYSSGKIIEELNVFMTPITKKSKSVKFSVEIPKFIYDKAMTNTEVEKRPVKNYIEGDTISTLHNRMGRLINKCRSIFELEKSSETSNKYIYLSFNSGERPTRDDFNFAYTGQRVSLSFRYYIAHETSDGKRFTKQRLQSGSGTTDKGIKGLIGDVDGNENYWIRGSQDGVQLKWTQEKEDYLKKLEGQFRTLSCNLNDFLEDIDEEKLLGLMDNGIKLLN